MEDARGSTEGQKPGRPIAIDVLSCVFPWRDQSMSSRREGSAQPPLFAVRGQIGRRQYWALALIGLVVPLLLWWAV